MRKNPAAVSGILCGLLSLGGFAQTQELRVPNVALPPGASLVRTGGWPQPEPSPFARATPPTSVDPEQQYSAGSTTRFVAASDVGSTAAHYAAQLTGLGWKKTFDSPHPSLAIHRYTVESPSGTHLGSVLVLAVPEQKYQFVGVRLVRTQIPWRWQAGRSGGAGANGATDLTLQPLYNGPAKLRLPELRLPGNQGALTPGSMALTTSRA